MPSHGSRPLTQRVEVGSYYTDGEYLVEVVAVNELGTVDLRDAHIGHEVAIGIDAFRRRYWLVKAAANA